MGVAAFVPEDPAVEQAGQVSGLDKPGGRLWQECGGQSWILAVPVGGSGNWVRCCGCLGCGCRPS